MGQDVAISLENVSKTFYVREKASDSIRNKFFNFFSRKNGLREIKALQGVNLNIHKGEFFGIIGKNGSGKSTLLKLIMGAYPVDQGGSVNVKGKIIRLSLGMGFDPALSARDNIYINGSVLGLTFRKIGSIFDEIIDFAGVENFVDTPLKFYSSGMRSRLSFAIAVHAEADIFLMDEFFGGVGDLAFREKSKEVFKRALIDGRTIVHVSHNLPTIKNHCDRVLFLDKGEVKFLGGPEETIVEYKKLFVKKNTEKVSS